MMLRGSKVVVLLLGWWNDHLGRLVSQANSGGIQTNQTDNQSATNTALNRVGPEDWIPDKYDESAVMLCSLATFNGLFWTYLHFEQRGYLFCRCCERYRKRHNYYRATLRRAENLSKNDVRSNRRPSASQPPQRAPNGALCLFHSVGSL